MEFLTQITSFINMIQTIILLLAMVLMVNSIKRLKPYDDVTEEFGHIKRIFTLTLTVCVITCLNDSVTYLYDIDLFKNEDLHDNMRIMLQIFCIKWTKMVFVYL